MSKRLSNNETILVGKWVEKNGTVEQDAVCKRIQWLIESCMELLVVDGNNWTALYRNPEDKSFWELTYPQSHLHGGGPPTLERMLISDACVRYGIKID